MKAFNQTLSTIAALVLLATSAQAQTTNPPAARGGRPVYVPEMPANPALPTLWLIGDSTVRNGTLGNGSDGLWGWGKPLVDFFDAKKVNVVNRAMGGTSSRSFQNGDLWKNVIAAVNPGDYVMIQFGHNDGSGNSIRGNGEETTEVALPGGGKETRHTFGWYMREYTTKIKEKGATPIICSLIPRNDWKDGKVTRNDTTYALWARQAAAQDNTLFIDLNNIIAARYEKLGEETVKPFFPKEHTHTGWEGAKVNADCVVEGLKLLKDCPLNQYLLPAPAAK